MESFDGPRPKEIALNFNVLQYRFLLKSLFFCILGGKQVVFITKHIYIHKR